MAHIHNNLELKHGVEGYNKFLASRGLSIIYNFEEVKPETWFIPQTHALTVLYTDTYKSYDLPRRFIYVISVSL